MYFQSIKMNHYNLQCVNFVFTRRKLCFYRRLILFLQCVNSVFTGRKLCLHIKTNPWIIRGKVLQAIRFSQKLKDYGQSYCSDTKMEIMFQCCKEIILVYTFQNITQNALYSEIVNYPKTVRILSWFVGKITKNILVFKFPFITI